jgi:1,4-dihydroxy-2-naphthoate octaprenyltransferase
MEATSSAAASLARTPERTAQASLSTLQTCRDLFIHLRLHFQLLLAPIFLWGFFLAGGQLGPRPLLAFVLVHAFLYGGATAFNSAYDRDEGPVGGLERPPAVSRALLPFSVGLLVLGGLLSGLVGFSLALLYAAILLFAVGYSHPLTRWKAGPWTSLATIFLGQGVLGFATGWAAAGAPLERLLGHEGVLGALAASLVVTGFYPLSQLFQIEEDRARGDRTLTVAWGPDRCFIVAEGVLLLGGLAILGLILPRYGLAEAALAAACFVGLIGLVDVWRRRFEPRAVLTNFRRVMRLNALAAFVLASYVGWHLVRGT